MSAARKLEPVRRCTLAVVEALVGDEGVERAGPGKAPTAFRIWRAGENMADDGPVFFTEESARLLLEEQASRGRPYSIDFDHLSLATNRQAMAGRAAGYHVLEVRQGEDGPELWAVRVDWCRDVKDGLEQDPPLWRWISPAFRQNDAAEITSYINLALCINPMTHGLPSLASSTSERKHAMTAEEMLSQLDAMIEATEDADQKAALVAAREALASKKDDEGEGSGDDTTEAADKDDDAGEKKAAADGDKDEDDDEKKKAAATTHAASGASTDPVATLTAKVLELERRDELREIDAVLAKHASLPEEFRAHCRTKSLADVRAMVKTVVGTKAHAERRTSPTQGTRQGDSGGLQPIVADQMDRAFGLTKEADLMPKRLEDGRFVMHTVRPSDLVRLNAQKGTK